MKFNKSKLALAAAMAIASCMPAASMAAGKLINVERVEAGDPYNGFIVKFKEGSAAQASSAAATDHVSALNARLKQKQTAGKAPVELQHVRRSTSGADVLRPSRALTPAEGSAVMRELSASDEVEFVEPNLRMYGQLVPNDALYFLQWGMKNVTNGIRPELAWDLARGAGVRIGVIDSGITNHIDLNNNVVAGFDFISDLTTANDGSGRDGNPSDPGDWCPERPELNQPVSTWHGTHVAGIAAARTNNIEQVAGVAFDAKIMPVRVLGKCGGDLLDVVDAVKWASGGAIPGAPSLAPQDVAKVINLSLGNKGVCGASIQQAITEAYNRGTTVVVAAGNKSIDVSEFWPANCANVIAVAAHTDTGARAWFSNFGTGIALSAPGVNITSTYNSGSTTPDPGTNTTAELQGTSMAAPHVAGVAALIQSYRMSKGQSRLIPMMVKSILTSSARPHSAACTGCGSGMLDAKAALDQALAPGWPALIGVRTDNKAYVQHYLGAPWVAMTGTTPVISATVSRKVNQLAAAGADFRLYTRVSSSSGDWSVVATNNNVLIKSVSTLLDGSLLAVGVDGLLYTRASETAPWVQIPGSGPVISAAAMPNGSVVAVGTDNLLRTRATLTSPWVVVSNSGPVQAVTVLTNGKIVGTFSGGTLQQRDTVNSPWVPLSGSSTLTSVNSMIY